MRIIQFSFRDGETILAKNPEQFASVLAAIVNAQEAQASKPAVSITSYLQREFAAENWPKHRNENPRFAFLKSKTAIEFGFSSLRSVREYIGRFQTAFNGHLIDVGVFITISHAGKIRMKEKSIQITYESAIQELEKSRSSMTVPLWVIGLK